MKPKSACAGLFVIAVFLLAQIPFGLAEWVSIGRAPGEAGSYSVLLEASYEGMRGVFKLPLQVGREDPLEPGALTIRPVYPIAKRLPFDLRYDISYNGSTDFELLEGNVVFYYLSAGGGIKSSEERLTLEDDGYWHVPARVPLAGEYKAVIKLEVENGGDIYGGDFVSHFEVESPSPDLQIDTEISRLLLTPAESFEVELEAVFEDSLLPDLGMFGANIYGTTKDLVWDETSKAYKTVFAAPTKEGIYGLNVFASGQDYLLQKNIYVAETAKEKSARCPLRFDELGGCTDMRDVRRCVQDYKSGFEDVKAEEIINCFDSAVGGARQGSVFCEEERKGDLDGDEHIDVDDLEVLQNLILPLDASLRKDYKACADYDLDGDVDDEDLLCLTNVVAGKWHGDFGGGICIDASYSGPLKGDFTGDDFVQLDDVAVMDYMLETVDAGIATPDEILDFADFDRDGRLGNEDRRCLMYFVGMDLDDPESLLGYGDAISDRCLRAYGLDECQNIRGDINGDLMIDAVDEILIMLITQRQVLNYDLDCADVNKDGKVTREDVSCIISYTAGDAEDYFVCLGCDENIPPDYRFRAEICGDGVDNDCDGLIDRTATGAEVDLCNCNSETPCWYVFDADGGLDPGIDDGKLLVCRKTGWDAANEEATGSTEVDSYRWVYPQQIACNSNIECESMYCANSEFTCAFDGFFWDWYEKGEKKLPYEDDDPETVPKVCEDGFDNDCSAGDIECQKPPSMWESWEFWVGMVIGAVVGWHLGPLYALLLGLLLKGLTMIGVVEAGSGLGNFLGGFGIGMAIGGLGSNFADGAYGAGSWGEGINDALGFGGESATTAASTADAAGDSSVAGQFQESFGTSFPGTEAAATGAETSTAGIGGIEVETAAEADFWNMYGDSSWIGS